MALSPEDLLVGLLDLKALSVGHPLEFFPQVAHSVGVILGHLPPVSTMDLIHRSPWQYAQKRIRVIRSILCLVASNRLIGT